MYYVDHVANAPSPRRRTALPCQCCRSAGPGRSIGSGLQRLDRIAHGDLARLNDVGAQAAAMDQALEDSGLGEALHVPARLAQLHTYAAQVADSEGLAHEVVQVHSTGHDVAPRL